MAKIIKFDPTGKKPKTVRPEKNFACDHKEVIAYTVYRKVYCAICGTELDSFDVLVDMLKAHVPSDPNHHDERRLERETEKLRHKK